MDVNHYFKRLQQSRAMKDAPVEPGINLAPGLLVTKKEGANSSLNSVRINSETLFRQAALNPPMLTEQDITTKIDGVNNVVYTLPNGGIVTIGFYDRANAGMHSNTVSSSTLWDSWNDLSNGRDPDFQRIPVLERQIGLDTLEGANFPKMFNYRSALFRNDRDTTFGMIIKCDDKALGPPVEVKDLILTRDYALEHPDEMTYLTGMVIEAARQRSIAENELDFLDAFGIGQIIKYHLGKGYDIKVNLTATPELAVIGRLNGMPLSLMANETEASEFAIIGLGSPGRDGQLYALRTAIFKDMKTGEGKSGDLAYVPIPREISVYQAEAASEAELPFGTLELQVMRYLKMGNVTVEFEKKEEPKVNLAEALYQWRQADDGMSGKVYQGFGRSAPSPNVNFTAGKVEVRNVKPVTLDLGHSYFGGMLVHDMFCLVHEESGKGLQMPYVTTP
ncbi:MAG: hypothetical protein ABIJ34_01830 [archaeon]